MGLVHTVASSNLGQILAAMEAAANRDAKTFSYYGGAFPYFRSTYERCDLLALPTKQG